MIYAESIERAIDGAKTQNRILIVFIYDDTDSSKKFEAILNEPSINTECQDFVAIKLTGNSESAAHFSAIYPVVVIPSLYFIGPNGALLEVQVGLPSAGDTELLQRIESARSQHTRGAHGENGATAAEKNNQSSLEERLESAQAKLLMKQKAREQQEREKEKEREKERREVGRSVSKLREQQDAQSARELAEELRRDKMEAAVARERVRAQIEADKLERSLRLQKEHVEQEKQRLEQRQDIEKQAAAIQSALSRQVRLQFRLRDGASFTETFGAEKTLKDAATWLANQIGMSIDSFTLVVVYPRRELLMEDMERSLLDLQLSPSAAISVHPLSNSGNRKKVVQTTSVGFFNWIMMPLLMIWAFLASLFTSKKSSPIENPSSSISTPSARPQPLVNPRGGTVRREGNMGRLRNPQDDPDPNATWNGNSTQQL